MFNNHWRVLAGVLVALALVPTAANAHNEQSEPSHVQIVPRRDYLTIQIIGDATDWHDVTSDDPHDESQSASKAPLNEDKVAAQYARTHLILEQGGQVLPLSVQNLQWKRLKEGDSSSERFEIFLRANRPAKLATTSLSVASDLFTNLEKASTIVQLGGLEKVVTGNNIVDFPVASTQPSLTNDLTDFASAGALKPLGDIPYLFLLAVLFLGASLLTLPRMALAVGLLVVGQSLTFLLDLTGLFHAPTGWSGFAVALFIALVGGTSWWLAGHANITNPFSRWGLAVLPLVAGLATGFSNAAPLRVWGLPENGLFLCALAYIVGLLVSHVLLAAILWPLIKHWKNKFTLQAQYGGMNWPRAVQIGSIVCGAIGSFYGLQLFAG